MLLKLHDRLRRDDEGFTLVEMVATMLIISFCLLGLISLQVQALRSTAGATQRQQATALANRTMEQLRALPYDTVSAGLRSCDTSGDPNISGTQFKPSYDASVNEALVTNSNACSGANVGPLYPHVQKGAATKVNKVTYRVRSYVTRADVTVAKGYFLTVVVDWSSAETHAQAKTIAVRSRLYSPTGCSSTSTATRPFAGPCQAFFYSDGGIAPAGISVTPVVDGTPLITGIDAYAVSATLPSLSARTQNEQIVSTQSVTATSVAKVTTSGGTTTTGGQTGTSAADTDPASGIGNQPASATAVTFSGATAVSGSGANGAFTASVPGTASGSAYSTTSAVASPACPDDANVTLLSNQACASGNVAPDGAYAASLSLNIPGRNLGTFTLASIASPATPETWRAFGARAITGVSGHCTLTSGIGCVASGARRTLGAMTAGGLPSAGAGDTVPAGFGGMVLMDGYVGRSYAEAGISPGSSTVTRSITNLRYWNGSGYTSLAPSATGGGSYALPITSAVYKVSGIPALQVDVSGTLAVSPSGVASSGTSPCQTTACTATSTVGSVQVVLQYQLTLSGVSMGSFVVTSNIGSTIAQTSYKAAPSA